MGTRPFKFKFYCPEMSRLKGLKGRSVSGHFTDKLSLMLMSSLCWEGSYARSNDGPTGAQKEGSLGPVNRMLHFRSSTVS